MWMQIGYQFVESNCLPAHTQATTPALNIQCQSKERRFLLSNNRLPTVHCYILSPSMCVPAGSWGMLMMTQSGSITQTSDSDHNTHGLSQLTNQPPFIEPRWLRPLSLQHRPWQQLQRDKKGFFKREIGSSADQRQKLAISVFTLESGVILSQTNPDVTLRFEASISDSRPTPSCFLESQVTWTYLGGSGEDLTKTLFILLLLGKPFTKLTSDFIKQYVKVVI